MFDLNCLTFALVCSVLTAGTLLCVIWAGLIHVGKDDMEMPS